MTTIEKKSKVKLWMYDFLFLCRELGYEKVPNWNEVKAVWNPFGETTVGEKKTAHYF